MSAYTESVEQVLDVSNDVAAELASIGDGILDALRDRLEIDILLRGNRLTIAGDDVHVVEARAVVDELVELVETGQEIGPATVDAVLKAIDQAENVQDVFGDVVWRHRGKQITPKTVTQKRYVDAIREQMQMFLTRLGFGSKVVVTGDVTQVDLPREQASGLIHVQDILGSIDGIAFIRFGHEDVVRHKLVQRIVEAYKLHAEETGTQRRK